MARKRLYWYSGILVGAIITILSLFVFNIQSESREIEETHTGGVFCDFCAKRITGSYHIYTDNTGSKSIICPSCDARLPKCYMCNRPMPTGTWAEVNGRKICANCFPNIKVCAVCKDVIKGKFWKDSEYDIYYCDVCYKTSVKCPSCGRPTVRNNLLNAANGSFCCPLCVEKLPRCKACELPIVGKSARFKHSDDIFCESCIKKGPFCSACGIPLGKIYWELPDKRLVCEKCHQTSIYDKTEAEKILGNIRRFLRNKYHLYVNNEITFKLIGKRGTFDQNSPLDGKELGIFKNTSGKAEILILYGLPAALFYETAAHEFAHAWHAENVDAKPDKVLLEGFAEWIASKVLYEYGFLSRLENLQERDDIYGEGYRRFAKIEEKYGIWAVFATAKAGVWSEKKQ